ncbi:glycosyltransferase involved in cell wall biosynthesis [Rhizobium laguerreae]|uniref:Glycosyltransferase involved in cell wall biosynthesis n=1 Tax=Rhizobium laguerreae TaxID=1076926 RepID=A0ABR6G468_9HYPH|nr:glycosyltransferase family 4 protein [Rhizobium laguerreae]MBB3161066.1 glycosyltransferase involved in cell wall biosynthesis [Rhizobium laguerreae]OOO51961.1 hypothetical protein BS630_06180 [Rhizobium laguerreae]
MKIVYIASSPVPSNAANSVHVMKMCHAMATLGHQVTLLSPAPDRSSWVKDPFDHYGVRRNFQHRSLRKIGEGRLGSMLGNLLLAALLRLHRPSLVYSRNLNAAWLAADAGFSVIFERHDVFADSASSKIRKFKNLTIHKKHIKTVVISSALRDEMISRYGIDARKLELAPDGADEIPEREPARANTSSLSVGYAGHLYPGRGIEVIGAVASRLPEIEFSIVGGNAEDVDHWKRTFVQLRNLKFLGHVAPKLVPSYLQSFDVLLAPYQRKVAVAGGGGDTSRWMSPLKIFEYMAAGRAIICSDLPVLREVLQAGEDALLVPPDDIDGWTDAIQSLAGDDQFRERLSKQSLAKFKAQYSWKKRAEKILEGIENGNE